jgi:hypothetical protein
MATPLKFVRRVPPTEKAPYGSQYNRGWRLIVVTVAGGIVLPATAVSLVLLLAALVGRVL